MRMKDLLERWEETASEQKTPSHYYVRLPLSDAAKLAALGELYPGRSEEELITDLLAAALDELEAAFPYIEGQRMVSEDEHGDPIYEDAGLTPKFQQLMRKHLVRLEEEFGR
ncbi:type 1 pili tip component [Alkalilimnicola ehrlichii]|uniref:Type 1 pili tip component n=1 Tax=Alkalilimnicola ehrlichii TaxID=351052 RepID=A0A3E0WZP9_9GAMM|nr:type 1 pili tip component [Alkalilimnicola ehrlichii]RFA30280.1 type 1 pili tip component [Alkalilimnicola ehrlichii]RFA37859.1 type 1 pili tip component [Alkalilimnicola ehrlichii]